MTVRQRYTKWCYRLSKNTLVMGSPSSANSSVLSALKFFHADNEYGGTETRLLLGLILLNHRLLKMNMFNILHLYEYE